MEQMDELVATLCKKGPDPVSREKCLCLPLFQMTQVDQKEADMNASMEDEEADIVCASDSLPFFRHLPLSPLLMLSPFFGQAVPCRPLQPSSGASAAATVI